MSLAGSRFDLAIRRQEQLGRLDNGKNVTPPLRILHLEDDKNDAELVQAKLDEEDLISDITRVETRADFISALDRGGFDIILADYKLPSFDGLSALALARKKMPEVPFIFLSGTMGEELAIETLKNGAFDYVLKQRLVRLAPAIRHALREAEEHAERKKAEKANEELSRQNELILNSASEGIFGLDLNGNHTFANSAAAQMLGYRVKELIGKNSHKTWHHSRADGSPYPEDECPITSVCKYGIIRRVTNEVFWKKDGTSLPVAYTCTPILEEDRLVGAVVTFRDITRRKKEEEELKKHRQRLGQLVDERTAELRTANERLEQQLLERWQIEEALRLSKEILGARVRLMEFANSHSLDEFLSATLDEVEALTGSTIGFYHFLEPDQVTLSLQNWSTNTLKNMCKAAGKGSHYDIAQAGVWVDCVYERRPVIHNDYASLTHRKGMPEGHAPVVRELVVPIFRGDVIKAIMGVGNKSTDYGARDIEIASQLGDLSWDVVERKRALEQLRTMSDELARSNSDLQQFAYVASHDLQEPLRVIGGFTNLLVRRYKGELDEKGREFLHYIAEGVLRMDALIKDLLEYSRVGTKGINLKHVDICRAVDEAVSNLRSAVEESGAIVSCDELPTVVADASQITRLFQNLIGNAIKFRGKEAVKVHVSAERKDKMWVFSVRDNGIGIEPGGLERIFAVFQRLHTREEYPGTGVGLAICKRIVERHGGSIWVESEPGRGSTFYFTIPDNL